MMSFLPSPRLARRPRCSAPPRCRAARSPAARSAAWRPAREQEPGLDGGDSLFNKVAADLDLMLRDWWTPDAEFFGLMRKDQLEAVAIESGASLRMGKLKDYSKKDLVSAMARQFERTADPAATLDEHDRKGRTWIPGVMSFPARVAATMTDPG